ncbi:MAG: Gfo/Idh/MocA family oxidoreductase [Verrucomicrobiae bacterium]|nr:Gfo/Idh/MocA family oxidoreductase [Verrucomicrobiae bacterium]
MNGKQKVRVGLIGLGFMGVTHLNAYQKVSDAEIVAVCDAVRIPENGKLVSQGNIGTGTELKLDFTRIKAYRDYQEMLKNPDVELVDICVPTPAHPEIAIAAMEAGKHVVCEKPMARTSELAKKMLDVSRKNGKMLMPAMCLRFWPEWSWLKNAISESRYGKILALRLRRVSQPPGWSKSTYFDGKASGGALFDLHIHDTDFVQFCFGKPKSVYSSGFTFISGCIDHVVTLYEVEQGVVVSAEGSWAMTEGFGFNMSYTAIFEKATADYDCSRGKDSLKLFEQGKNPTTVIFGDEDGYAGELKHAVECVLSGKPPRIVTAEEGVSAIEICEAEEKSVYSRCSVNL